MKRVVFIIALVFASACAPSPLPTQTLVTLSATSSPATPSATSTETPTAIATGTPTSDISLRLSDTPVALIATPVAYDRNPSARLIEADVSTDETVVPRDMHVPMWRLYGDGTVVFAGERSALSSGLDAVVRVGHLSPTEIQNLFVYLNQVGFFSLGDAYQPRPAPTDAPTVHISVYLNKVKTVRVLAPDSDATPQAFADALKRLTQTVPADAQTVVPADAYLQALDAGAVNNLRATDLLTDWAVPGIRLADATDGIDISGNTSTIVGAIISNSPLTLFREGNRAYRVRFAPNLPRAPHLTDWIGIILDAPREFDGRFFDIVGYYRGANVFGEASGNPPVARSDWVIADDTGAIYVTGVLPPGLDPSSRADAWSVVHVTARVVYVRLGTSHLEARRSDILSRSAPTPTPTVVSTPSATITATRTLSPTMTSTPALTPIADVESAIAAVKARFPDVAKIQKTSAGLIGASTNITALERTDGWDLAFWQGSGDCPAGCINNHYYYFSAKKDGRVTKVGEYTRIYNDANNSFDTTGAAMWGVPK